MNQTLKIYIPVAGSMIDKVIERGSGIVGVDREDGSVLLHFEGNLFGAANLKRHDERVKHAAGRLVSRYPTRAMMVLAKDEVVRNLIEVGEYDADSWRAQIKADKLDALRDYTGEEG